KGYGAVFVLSPRLLPARRTLRFEAPFQLTDQGLERIIKTMENDLQRAPTPELRAHIQGQIDNVRRIQAVVRAQMQHERLAAPDPEATRTPPPRSRSGGTGASPAELKKQIRQMEQQAEEMAAEAEQLRREGDQRLEQMMGSGVAPRALPGGATPASDDSTPQAPQAPPAFVSRFWFETEDEAAPSPDP